MRLEEESALFIVKAEVFVQQQELSLPRCCSRRCEAGTQKRGIHRLCEVMSITEESAGSDGQTVGSYCRRRLLCFEEQGSDKQPCHAAQA